MTGAATLISVNVGLPKDVRWHGKTVHTGIFKAPVAGPVMVRWLNLDGDGLLDDEVCIGDLYRIGEAEFEVTQPRVTCYRVGMRLGQPQLPALAEATPSAGSSAKPPAGSGAKPPAGSAVEPVVDPAPAWPGFRPLRVTRIIKESSTVSSILLDDPAGSPLPTAPCRWPARRPTRPRRPKRSARGARSGPSAWISLSAPVSRTGSGAA